MAGEELAPLEPSALAVRSALWPSAKGCCWSGSTMMVARGVRGCAIARLDASGVLIEP